MRNSQASARAAKLVVLSVNDVHDVYADERGRGGIASFATLLARERAAVPTDATLLVTLNGDFLSGSELGERCKGEHMIELMNQLGIQYVVLGNHEFDFGCQVLRERIKASKFKYFGSNVLESKSGELFEGVIDTDMIELSDGLKLGLFGVTTEDTPLTSYPGDDVVFDDVTKVAKRCVEQLQSEGADFILALTHLLIDEDRQLARRVKGINVMLGGHDHEPFTLYEGNTLIHKSGQNAQWLVRLEFELTKLDSQPLNVSTQWSMIANQHIAPDAAYSEIVQKYARAIEEEDACAENAEVLAVLTRPLSTKTEALRSRECNMGSLVADALRSGLKADFALVNGGFIRGDKFYHAGSSLTTGILNKEMPFPRPGVLVRICASDLQSAITQHLAKYPQRSGSFPHVSGLRLTIDATTLPPVVSEMKDESGNEIDSDAIVLVATTKFLADGGDGCSAWLRGEILHVGSKVAVYVADFARKQRVIAYPEVASRITFVE